MSISFYDASVGSYLQILEGTAGILELGKTHAEENGLDLQEIVMKRMREDMMPFHFQVVSTAHHSWGAIQAIQKGAFSPPSFELDKDYAGLQALIEEARNGLAGLDRADVDALADGNLIFKLGKNEIPFTARNFVLSFSLPNFYFHATTTYDILRMAGAPLGKMAFIGPMKAGV
ncbi:MAG: DUF1993 domain-containing protein [bacterium]|nr:DUF1993 domain-containing protein [bacterium]